MTDGRRSYVLDHIEGDTAIVVADDDGSTADLPRGVLPPGAREGSVVVVEVGEGGRPAWATAVLDEPSRLQRLEELQAKIDHLEGRDPGGDVIL